jgi:hypothetical protein
VDAVGSELVSAMNSLVSGNFVGKCSGRAAALLAQVDGRPIQLPQAVPWGHCGRLWSLFLMPQLASRTEPRLFVHQLSWGVTRNI